MEASLLRLIKKIRNEEVVLWAGAGMSIYAGVPSGGKLAEKIIGNAEEDEKDILNNKKALLQDVAEEFVQMRNGSKNELFQIVMEQVVKEYKDIHIHEMVTKIPQIRTIITTNYDRLFEQAYGNNCEVVIHNQNIPFAKNRNKVKLYKIHGDFSFPQSVMLTRSDYNNFFQSKQLEPLWDIVRAIIAQNTILFVGYSLEDQNIEVIFNQIIDKLGDFHCESFFVSPKLPLYKQKNLTKKHIQYIDMTAEELFSNIKSEIDKNILLDCKNGTIGITTAQKILREKSISVNFKVDDSIKISSIKATDNLLFTGSLKLRTDLDKSIKENFYKIISGKKVGTVILPEGSLLNLKQELKGINIPLVDDWSKIQLEIKTTPNEKIDTNLVSSKSGNILENVRAELYKLNNKVIVEFIHTSLRLRLDLDLLKEEMNFNFEYGKLTNIIEGKKLLSILNNWINDDEELLVYNTCSSNVIFTIPSIPQQIKEESKKHIKWLNNLCNNLFDIQNYYKVNFKFPDKITKEDNDKIERAVMFIKNRKVACNNLKVTLDFNESCDIYKYIQMGNKECKLSLISAEKESFELFGVELEIGKYAIEVNNPYFENLEEIQKMIEHGYTKIPAIINSKNNEMFTFYKI
ncbi:SIR2 family protein [Clostridium fermenticellae]|uniref:SIR2 family protein n=1 Tax=Clostridium fermenticellae TaxID=2068654 RepID=A0A386H2A9_9CLOT|nr:SIR2 family protein [Clostridium fermenticellae]AYD39832.1 SIR2 family protein [Clostridium fermenticellae]